MDQIRAFCLVCQNKNAVGVGVVNVPMWQKGMEERLNRGVQGGDMQFMNLHLAFHFFIFEALQGPKFSEKCKVEGNEIVRLNIDQINPASLDEKNFLFFPQDIFLPYFNRGIPAAV